MKSQPPGSKKQPQRKFPRDIRAIAIARLISEMGDELALIALLFRLKDSGPRAVSLLIGLFAAARILLAPISGTIVDRFPTRRLIGIVSCGQFVITGVLAFTQGHLLYPLVFLLAVGGSIVGPAWQSFIAHVIPTDRLSTVYAFIQSYRAIAVVAGAGVGGFVVDTFGSRTALLVNASTFLFVGAVAISLQSERRPRGYPAAGRDMVRGFLSLLRQPVLRWSLILLASFNMSAGVIEVLSVFLITDEMGGSAADYGIVLGSLGASMALTGMVLSRMRLRAHDTTLLIASAVLSAIGMMSYSLSPSIPIAVAAFFINGAGLTGLHVFGTPVLVRHTKEEERGRIFAASSSITTGGILLASGIAGAVAEFVPTRPVIMIAAFTCLASAFFSGARIRHHDKSGANESSLYRDGLER
jgi:MFS family permease